MQKCPKEEESFLNDILFGDKAAGVGLLIREQMVSRK